MINERCIKCGTETTNLAFSEKSILSNLLYVGIEGHLWWKKYYIWTSCPYCFHICKRYLTKWEALSYDAYMKRICN